MSIIPTANRSAEAPWSLLTRYYGWSTNSGINFNESGSLPFIMVPTVESFIFFVVNTITLSHDRFLWRKGGFCLCKYANTLRISKHHNLIVFNFRFLVIFNICLMLLPDRHSVIRYALFVNLQVQPSIKQESCG